MPNLSFQNTEIAFAHKSTNELKQAKLLFKSFNYPWLIKHGDSLAKLAITLGCKSVIKNTIFKQFCGGESIDECELRIQSLAQSDIGTILDYSVEGEEEETVFIATCAEIKKTIDKASGNPQIPFSVFKVTGIIAFDVLEMASIELHKNAMLASAEIGELLSRVESQQWQMGVARFFEIAKHAYSRNVRLFVDAEESWIQPAIDRLAEEAMKLYNVEKAIIFNTIQLYRHDRLAYLNHTINSTTGFLGFKLVRGAYMEKERARAKEKGYEDPIQPNKSATDDDYNSAVKVCLENNQRVSVCIGTHNEESSLLGTQIQAANNIDSNSSHVFYSQLLGMSDHISYNLAHAKYNVCKYVPYGPVSAVIPYLTRRAQENSGMAGQMGRELSLINSEIIRRKS